jgi:type I restriction enzyme S subunit
MSEWKKVKLGDCITTKKGFAFKSQHYVDNGIPVVRVSDFTLDSISNSDLVYYPIAEYEAYSDYVLTEKDILIQTVGSWQYNPNSVVGKVVRVPYYHEGSLLNQNIVKIIPNKNLDKGFIYYRLKCRDFSGFVVGEARGAANQASITLDTIKRFSFALPPISTQQRIATILSRYDTLIENYQKQIKLLEEAAQRLYKEWFVDLRFPGYENVKMVDGLPEGWEKGMLDDIAYESGKKVDKKKRELYDCYLPIDCLPKHSLTYLTPADITLAESSLVSFEENDIIFGAMRPYFHKVCFAQSNGLTRSTCFVLNSRQKEYREYLLMLMFDDNTVKHATSISVGTTMPYTRWKEFKTMVVLIPNTDIAKSFGLRISHITNRLRSLSSQIRLLTEARDRLLPRLMGGEIEV